MCDGLNHFLNHYLHRAFGSLFINEIFDPFQTRTNMTGNMAIPSRVVFGIKHPPYKKIEATCLCLTPRALCSTRREQCLPCQLEISFPKTKLFVFFTMHYLLGQSLKQSFSGVPIAAITPRFCTLYVPILHNFPICHLPLPPPSIQYLQYIFL